jgi:trimeric autotransporter adhesin
MTVMAQTCAFDDGNSSLSVEGLVLTRYALGITGAPLVANTGINAVDAPTVEAAINCPSCGLNITGNPTMTVADATIISRKLAGFSGPALTNGIALGSGTRNTPAAVQSFLLAGCGATGGTVTSVATGAGLTGGPITGAGTIGLAASQLLPTTTCGDSQTLIWNNTSSNWICAGWQPPGAGGATFGARLTGTSANEGFRVDNAGNGDGIAGYTSSSLNLQSGVSGFNTNATGNVAGVYGEAYRSPAGTGVFGLGGKTGVAGNGSDRGGVFVATNTAGLTAGLEARATNSPTGTGVTATGTITGGYFAASSVPAGGYTPTGLFGVASAQGVGVKAIGGTAIELDGAIKVSGTNRAAFRVAMAETGGSTAISSALTTNDPNVAIFITSIGGGTGTSTRVDYNDLSGIWSVVCVRLTVSFCPTQFNVLVIKQ